MRGVKALSLVAKAILVSACLVMIIPSVINLCPSLVGADASYIVLGGSMKPALRPGDLAFTEEVDPAEVEVGDIVAVRTDSWVYMHRVVEKKGSGEGILFRLNGDANEDPDSSYVSGSEIIGRTIFSIPMGYLYTKNGYVLIVATPLMLLAFNQAVKIYKVYDRKRGRRRGLKAILLGPGDRMKRKIPTLDTTSVLLLIILMASGTQMMTPYFTSGGGSFFTDTESSSGNFIGAGTWKVPSTITCSVDPSSITLGESVIISGSINPARSAEVTIEISSDDGKTWTSLPTVTSKLDGIYECEWKPAVAGSYNIKASWEGDCSYFGDSSGIVTVSVISVEEPPEGGS